MKISSLLIALVLGSASALSIAADTASKDSKVSAADFVKHAGAAGLAEVEMGKLGEKKATNPQVKTFAQKMVADHSKANDQLKSIVAAKGLEVPGSAGMMNKAVMEKFEHQDADKDFDHDFMQKMVKDHEAAVELFEKAANDASLDPDLRTFAKKTLPTLRGHLKDAQALEGKVSN